jgi:hypothetical protein
LLERLRQPSHTLLADVAATRGRSKSRIVTTPESTPAGWHCCRTVAFHSGARAGTAGQVVARARRVMPPDFSTRVISSHHCQLWRLRSPMRRASCHPPSPRSPPRAIGAARTRPRRGWQLTSADCIGRWIGDQGGPVQGDRLADHLIVAFPFIQVHSPGIPRTAAR